MQLLQPPPIYDSPETFGMKKWFQRVWDYARQQTNIITITAAYTIPGDIYHVRADGTSAAYAVTLPDAKAFPGRKVSIVKIDAVANSITVTRAGTDVIESGTTVVLANQWDNTLLISNGTTGWEKIV